MLIDKQVLVCAESLRVGTGSHFAMRAMITGGGHVVIEKFSGLGFDSVIVSSSDQFEGGHRVCGPMVPLEQRNLKRPTTTIGQDCFIPLAVYIMPGAKVAEGSVYMPGSTVRKEATPWTIWGPSRLKKFGVREKVKFDDPDYSKHDR